MDGLVLWFLSAPLWVKVLLGIAIAILWMLLVPMFLKMLVGLFKSKPPLGGETAKASDSSAAATGSRVAVSTSGAGQVLAGVHAGRDIHIHPPIEVFNGDMMESPDNGPLQEAPDAFHKEHHPPLPSQATLEALCPGRKLMLVVEFHVPGPPVPKQRPRVTQHGAYYPDRAPGSKRLTYPEYKELVGVEFCKAMLEKRGPHSVDSPLSGFKGYLLVVAAACNRGDFDNVAGSCADALSGLAWQDDKQVAASVVLLERGVKPQNQGLMVVVYEIQEE